MQKQNNNGQPKIVYQGRTKSEIAHLHFCSKLFNVPFEEMIKPFTFSESYYESKDRDLKEDDF